MQRIWRKSFPRQVLDVPRDVVSLGALFASHLRQVEVRGNLFGQLLAHELDPALGEVPRQLVLTTRLLSGI